LLEQIQLKLFSIEPLFSSVRLLESFIQSMLQSIHPAFSKKHLQKLNTLQKDDCSTASEFDNKFSLQFKPVIKSLLETLVACSVSVDCFQAILTFYLDLVSVNPTPTDLKNIFLLTRKASFLEVAVLRALLEVLQNVAVEPKEVFIFPQKAHADAVQRSDEGNVSNESSHIAPGHHAANKGPRGPNEYRYFHRQCAVQFHLDQMSLHLNDGFGVSFWLRVKKGQERVGLLLNPHFEQLFYS
uniref:DRIM domain-containing protein n=1 Tax=Gongylonema pulchrum TaxID=637853 RepID=A0A183D083_9BILA